MGFFSLFLRSKLTSDRNFLRPLPYIEESVVRLNWASVDDKFDLIVEHASPEIKFRIDPNKFYGSHSSDLSQDIYDNTTKSLEQFKRAFEEDINHKYFLEWWKAKANSFGQLFQFNFSNGPWEIPWEYLLDQLVFEKTRFETSIVRCLGNPQTDCSSILTNSLSTLIIKADAPNLELDKDIDQIIAAWKGLEYEVRCAINKPIVIEANKSNVISKLREIKPNIVWFTGHGYYRDAVRIIFSENEELTAKEFADLFVSANHCPELAVFWACKTAGTANNNHAKTPELFVELQKKGVFSVIGMQSVIHDDAAIVMSSKLFRGLSQGLPVEWAIANAREWIYENNVLSNMDWAAPVIWSAKRPVVQLDWGHIQRFQFQRQLLGRISLSQGQKGTEIDEEPPSGESLKQAFEWINNHVTIVRGDPQSEEHKLWFIRIIKGIQTISKQPVLLLNIAKGKYPKKSFELWAEEFLSVLELEKGALPDEFIMRMDILQNNAELGWRRICAMEEYYLAIIDPPPASENWFWDPLFSRSASFAIMTQNEVPEKYRTYPSHFCTAGSIPSQMHIEAALKSYSRIMLVLAILNIPVRKEILNSIDLGEKCDELFDNFPDLFVKSFGGYIISSVALSFLLKSADSDQIHQAQKDALLLSEKLVDSSKPYLFEKIIYLSIELGYPDNATKYLSALLHIYWNSQQIVQAIRVINKYISLKDALNLDDVLQIASVYIQRGEQNHAKFWLSNCNPKDPLEQVFKLQLEAELYKNKAELNKAMELIQNALDLCVNLMKMDSSEDKKMKAQLRYLEILHDKARLTHWKLKDYRTAIQEYEEVIEKCENGAFDNKDFKALLAVTHRNLGECVLFIEEGAQEDRWRNAESHLQSALSYEKSIDEYSPLIAETYYQLAKLAEKKGLAKQYRDLLCLCIEFSEESHHKLLSVIAKNRLLWLDFTLEGTEWSKVNEYWELIADNLRSNRKHVWALRTLITSNIRASKVLITQNEIEKARTILIENLFFFRSNKELRSNSDQERILTTLGGINTILTDYGLQVGDNESMLKLEKEFADAIDYASRKGINPKEAFNRSI